MKYFFQNVLLAILFTANISFTQNIATTVSNALRYGTGNENVGEAGQFEIAKEYLDNISDVRLFASNFTLGFRLELSNPPEFGIPFRGLRKKYIEFQKENFSVRAGDSYALFGRGLALHLFENRTLAFDNSVEGIRATYRRKYFSATILGGDIHFVEPSTLLIPPLRKENYQLRAATTEINIIKQISLGASYTWAQGFLQTFLPEINDTIVANIPEVFASLRFPFADAFVSFAEKKTRVGNIDSAVGSALYFSLSHSGKQYGVTMEYKNYHFDIVHPFNPSFSNVFRPTRMLPFQNPPIVHKEHSLTLLTRYPHLVNFNDEVGFQLDGFFAVNPNMTLNGNFSMASKHNAYEINWKNFQLKKLSRGKSWLPSLAKERAPFWEWYFDVDYFFKGEESYVKIGYDRRSEIVYEIFAFEHEQYQRITVVPLIVQYAFDEIWSVKISSEQQWLNKFPTKKRYYTQLISMQLSHSPDFSFGFRYEFTDSPNEPKKKKNWLVFECGYRIGTNHTLTLAYGSERGGQVCSNGICRTVNPFNGTRFSMTNHF